MAYITERVLKDGTKRFRVAWREAGKLQSETFGARKRAERFQRDVEGGAGDSWPEGWVKGRGFIQLEPTSVEPPSRSFYEVATEYAEQRTSITPGTRRDYYGYAKALRAVELPDGSRPFDCGISVVSEEGVTGWIRHWPRSLKTKSNQHGFVSGVLTYAVKKGYREDHPAMGTAPKRRQVRQEQREPVYLTAGQFRLLMDAMPQGDGQDMARVLVGTGLRWGELSALWAEDIDLGNRQLHVRKAWKSDGRDGERQIPPWLERRLQPKHAMRAHYLGTPKTPRSARTINLSMRVTEILERWCRGKLPDDFVFQTKTGRPWHGVEFLEQRWEPARTALQLRDLRVHDLRHSHVAWSVKAGENLADISNRLGHESVAFTFDIYHRLLTPSRHAATEAAIDAALGGPVVLRDSSADDPGDAEASARRAG